MDSGAETMMLTKFEEEWIIRCKGKIVRKIHGWKRVVEGVYQRLTNSEVRERLQGEDIVKAIKTQRLWWYGHIRCMGEKK